jgi:hypothetical protein
MITKTIHPIWEEFMRYCETMNYGEINKLKIKDGLPMVAEEVKEKIVFYPCGNKLRKN